MGQGNHPVWGSVTGIIHRWDDDVAARLFCGLPSHLFPREISTSAEGAAKYEIAGKSTQVCQLFAERPWLYFISKDCYWSLERRSSGRCVLNWFSNQYEHLKYVEQWVTAQYAMDYEHGGFGLQSEYLAIHGYDIPIVDRSPRARIMGWVGRNVDKYLPGIYWANILSDRLIERFGLAPLLEILSSSGYVRRMPAAYFVRMYDSPSDWEKYRGAIDAILSGFPKAFCRASTKLPEFATQRNHAAVIRQLHKEWP